MGARESILDEIRQCRDQGLVLPGSVYRDPEILEAEIEALFRPGWMGVACGQNVPEPGDLFPVQIAGHALLLTRDREGEVRVFYNLCRHRGALLASEPCRAPGGRIVCPYHGWSFGLDGRFESAPHFDRRDAAAGPSDADRAGLGLIPLRSAVWRDIVFVNLSGDAPPFDAFIAPLEERVRPWTAAELRDLSSVEYEIEANWKLAAENFLDAYHLPIAHPEIGGGFSGALLLEDLEVSGDIVGLAMPQGYGPGSGQLESQLPRFSGLGEERQHLEAFVILPNTLLIVEPDIQQVIVLRPQSPSFTEETLASYVVSDVAQREELASERAEFHQSVLLVNDQDAALLAGLQQARSMDVGERTRPSPSWDETILRFQRAWADRLLGRPPRAE